MSGWLAAPVFALLLGPAAAIRADTGVADDPALLQCAEKVRKAERPNACVCYYELAKRTSSAVGSEALRRLEAADAEGDACAPLMLGRRANAAGEAAVELDAYDRASRRAAAEGEHEILARAQIRSAFLLQRQNRLTRAALALEIGRDQARLAGNTSLESRAILGLEEIRMRTGADLRSIEARLLELLEDPGLQASREAAAWSQLGTVQKRLGHISDAEKAFERARTLFLQLERPRAALVDEFNLSLSYIDAIDGDREMAIRALEKIATEAAQFGEVTVESTARSYLGGLYGGDEGIAIVRRGLELARGIEGLRYRFEALEEMASILATEDPVSADGYLKELEEMALRHEDVSMIPYLAEPRMRVAWALGRAGLLEAADPDLGALGEFARIGEAALDELEQTTDLQLASGGRAELFSLWIESYDWLAGALLAEAFARAAPGVEAGSEAAPFQLGLEQLDAGPVALSETREIGDQAMLETAFRVLERRRSRQLRRALADKEQARAAQNPELGEIHSRMESIYRQLLEGGLESDRRTDLVRRLEQLEAREREVAREAEARAREIDQRAERLAFVDLESARRTLAENEALVIFQLAPWQDTYRRFYGGSWVWVLSRDRQWLRPIEGIGRLSRMIDLFTGLLPTRDGSEIDAARKVGDRIFGSMLGALPAEIDHLLILPDGPSHLLPFSALVIDGGNADGNGDGNGDATLDGSGHGPMYLARRFGLSRLPSATLWREMRTGAGSAVADPETRRQALVLADPALPTATSSTVSPDGAALGTGSPDTTEPPPTSEQGSAQSHASTGSERASAADRYRAGTLDLALSLGRLPGAAAEGKAIQRRLGGGTRLLSDNEANEAVLEEMDLSDYGILHFAAHALVDAERDRRSGVVLARGSENDDGLLQPHEIEGLELDGHLVILSACQSAEGRILRGEGPSSLARAFHLAGARAVVAGLWRLRDDEALRFFEVVYSHLAEGADIASAVRHAREASTRAGLPPEAWSGLVVIGDGTLRPFPGGLPDPAPRWRWVLVALALLGSIALFRWLLRHRRAPSHRAPSDR